MKHYLLTLLLLIGIPVCAADDLSALYQEVDDAIEHSPEYVGHYEWELQQAKEALAKERSSEKRLLLLGQLYDMYKAFECDSALYYNKQYITLADQLGHTQLALQGRIRAADRCATVGLYTEAIGILHDIQSRDLDKEGQAQYFQTCMYACGELAYYTKIPSMHDYYTRLHDSYRDSLFMVADPESEACLLAKENNLREAGKLDEAMKINDVRLNRAKEGTRDYAIVAYYRHLICLRQGNIDDAKAWLAKSGLCDVRQAVMDQAALLALAELIQGDGELERSYRYVRFTWDCNNRFSTRMRTWQITPILNVIENNYQATMQRNNRLLACGIMAVSLLAVLLVGALFFLRRRNKQLSAARNALHNTNQKLSEANIRLSDVNAQLSSLNAQLERKGDQLSDANKVKEEYIGRFLSLCSQYIDKLDNYRKMVNKKMKNKELDELFRISKSTELKEKEVEELFQNFDSAFLHLFPHFVEDFNALLQPEMRIYPKEENRLPTDLRIFALIRLGIDDSSKIAEFLHYSVNTIYNYRARTKNGAIGNRDEFERRVKELGMS